VDEKTAVTASTVTENWPMVDSGAVRLLVLVELVAQTAGVCLGWKEHQEKGETIWKEPDGSWASKRPPFIAANFRFTVASSPSRKGFFRWNFTVK
jgi:hypothetical protein